MVSWTQAGDTNLGSWVAGVGRWQQAAPCARGLCKEQAAAIIPADVAGEEGAVSSDLSIF